MTKHPVHVTRPSLAPLAEFIPLLETIWDSGVMTHNGPLVQRFEQELAEYLNVPDVICVSNGSSALQLAIRALDLSGEIITTPFTFIATANIISWERCTPVFVDICPDSWNIDAEKIEASITARTTAILAVHVFSAPCDITRLTAIAGQHKLKLIFDGAHAMAVKNKGVSILKHGDISTLSFHATKLLNTAEGGACVTADPVLAKRLRRMRFFGFDESKQAVDAGINAKMSEISAALGIANLRHLDTTLSIRKNKYELYQRCLENLSFVRFQSFQDDEYNYGYLPILLDNPVRREGITMNLEKNKIYPRRYFYPALHTLSIFAPPVHLPVAEHVSENILCLPLFDTLSENNIIQICNIISKV